MSENKAIDPRIQTVEDLIQKELAELHATYKRASEIRKRIEDLRKLYPAVSTNSEGEENWGRFPKRMKPENLKLLRLIASRDEGFQLEEILRMCAESNLMDEKHAKFFIKNYQGDRYRMLEVLPTSNLAVTKKGRAFLSLRGLNRIDEDSMK